MSLVQGGKIYTLGPQGILDCGYIAIRNGVIQDVNSGRAAGKPDIVAKDFVITPGLIDPHTHVGLYRLEGERGDHGVENSDPVTPQLNVLDGFDPFDPALEDAFSGGVTTVGVLPGGPMSYGESVERISLIPGQCAVVKCNKKLVQLFSGIKLAVGEHPKRFLAEQRKSPTTRMGQYAVLRSYLLQAKDYGEKKVSGSSFFSDAKLEALLALLEGKVQARVHAHTVRDILAIIRLAEETGVPKVVLDHGTEAYLIAKTLKEKQIPVVLGPIVFSRRGTELKNLSTRGSKILHDEGVLFSLTTDHPTLPIQYYSLLGSLAVSENMDRENALRLLTVNPAKILGLAQRVGSIEEGKEADIVIWSGDPFDPTSRVVYTLVDGQIVYQGR